MNNYGQPYGNQSYGNQSYGNQGYSNQGYPNQGGYPMDQQSNGQRNGSGFDNYAKIKVIGRLTQDPTSKIVNNSKVGTSKIAINHRSEKAGTDFWFIEVWGNEGADSKYNFLINHCPKGRRVFVEGIPELRQQKNQDGSYSYYPTIKVTELVGLEMPKGSEGAQQQPTGQYQGGFQAPPQGNFNPSPQQQQGGFTPPPAPPQGGGFPPNPAQSNTPPAPQGGFPPNPPGGGYGAPVGAPNGGFPPAPPQGA